MVASIFAALPASASALTLGSLDPENTDPGFSGYCVASQGNLIQGSVAPGGPSYIVPQGGGTITSWSTRWGIGGSGVALELWRPDPTTSGTSILVAKDSESLSPDASGVSTYSVSIPVAAGDYIGLYWPTGNTVPCDYDATNDMDTVWLRTGVTPIPGNPETFSAFIVPRDIANLEANLQQTADLSLSQSTNRPTIVAGNAVNFLLTASNAGPSPVTAAVTDRLPAGMTFFSAAAAGGSCSGSQTVTCQVPLGVGDSQTISIVAVARAPGPLTNTAAVSSSATDATPADNSSSATVEVVSIPTLGSISKRAGHRRETFNFTLDQAATVKAVLQRAGRQVATISLNSNAGSNSVRSKKLAPGRYKAIFTASDAAGTSPPQSVTFRIH